MIDEKLLLDGDMLLFHTRGFSPISMAIRQLTGSFWNHIGVYYTDLYRKGYIVEALGNGVVKTPIEKYISEKKHILKVVRFRPEAFKDKEEYKEGIATFVGRMYDKIGSKYDIWAIVFLGFKFLCKSSYKKFRQYVPIGNPLQSRESFFCSEIVCESAFRISSLNAYLFRGETNQVCDTTTPKDCGKSKWVKFIGGKDVN